MLNTAAPEEKVYNLCGRQATESDIQKLRAKYPNWDKISPQTQGVFHDMMFEDRIWKMADEWYQRDRDARAKAKAESAELNPQ